MPFITKANGQIIGEGTDAPLQENPREADPQQQPQERTDQAPKSKWSLCVWFWGQIDFRIVAVTLVIYFGLYVYFDPYGSWRPCPQAAQSAELAQPKETPKRTLSPSTHKNQFWTFAVTTSGAGAIAVIQLSSGLAYIILDNIKWQTEPTGMTYMQCGLFHMTECLDRVKEQRTPFPQWSEVVSLHLVELDTVLGVVACVDGKCYEMELHKDPATVLVNGVLLFAHESVCVGYTGKDERLTSLPLPDFFSGSLPNQAPKNLFEQFGNKSVDIM